MFIKRIFVFTFLCFFAFIFTVGCEKSYKAASGYQAERLMAYNVIDIVPTELAGDKITKPMMAVFKGKG